MMVRLKNESGFALILTLVVTALMVAVVVEMIHQVYVDTSLSRGFRDGQQASILAESGVTGVKMLLSINANNPTIISTLLATPLTLEDEVGSLVVKISDESGKININGLLKADDTDDEIIKNTLLRLKKPIELQEETWSNVLDSVADWIDKGNDQRLRGAETPYYRTLKPPYSAHNDRLISLTELSLVKGITPMMLDGLVDKKDNIRLRDCLTIYPTQQFPLSTINVNSAPKAVLMALDISITDSVADQIIKMRPFNKEADFSKVDALNNIYRNGNSWGPRLTTKSQLFRITAVAKVKESVRTVEAVVSSVNFLSWQEY